MKAKIYSILLLSAIGLVGCVDSDYDLSSVSSDNFAIGDDNTEFDIPVATITLTSSDIDGTTTPAIGVVRSTTSEDITFQEMLDLTNAFLPSGTTVNISMLKGDTAYTGSYDSYIDELVWDLISELQISEQKRLDLAEILIDYEESGLISDSVYSSLGIEDIGGKSTSEVAEEIDDAVNDSTDEELDAIAASIVALITDEIIDKYLAEYSEITIEESVDAINLSDDILDFFSDNELIPILTYDNDLPFEISIDSLTMIDEDGNEVDFLSSDSISLDDLKSILSGGAKLNVAITLDSFSSGDNTGEETITLKLALKIKGALTFSL